MHEIKKGENKFYIGEDIKEPIAELTFIESGKNRIVADHTMCPTNCGDKGLQGNWWNILYNTPGKREGHPAGMSLCRTEIKRKS